MRTGFGALASAGPLLLVAGCGGAGPGGAKTALNEAQFAEVKANCQLGAATLRASNSSTTRTNSDGSTSTVTIEYEGAPDQTTIVLPSGMGDGEVAQAIVCLGGEFNRLGAEARVEPPGGMKL